MSKILELYGKRPDGHIIHFDIEDIEKARFEQFTEVVIKEKMTLKEFEKIYGSKLPTKHIEIVSSEHLIFDRTYFILNKILHELNSFDSSLFTRYEKSIINGGFENAIHSILKIMYNDIPYTNRSYFII